MYGYTTSPGAPAECTNVIAVGWTQLATDSSARGYADTIPSSRELGGGLQHTIISKGGWQADPSCSTRMISDISANGDNVAAYCTSPAGSANWHVTGGSSASSPFTSGVLATLGVTSIPGFNAAWIYANQKKFFGRHASGGPVSNCPKGSPRLFLQRRARIRRPHRGRYALRPDVHEHRRRRDGRGGDRRWRGRD